MRNAKQIYPTFREEQKLWQRGCEVVVGLDEVGRGPLAGPVVAAGVWFATAKQTAAAKIKERETEFNPPTPLSKGGGGGLRDSKKLSSIQREKWYKILTEQADIKWGVGIVSEKIIDKINILEATKLAMRRAIEDLTNKFLTPQPPFQRGARGVNFRIDYLLLDGNFLLEDLSINQKSIIRGDEKVISCAAASIIAKVTRDRLMLKYHKKFPQYGFDKHKGYGTKRHFEAIKQYGSCGIHRISFNLAKNKFV